MTQPAEYDPERHDAPPVLNVHLAALQEIDKVVGNELTLDVDDTTRLRGILRAAMSEAHLRKPARPNACGAFQPNPPSDMKPYRCTKPHGHVGRHRAAIDGRIVARWPIREETP